MPIYLAFMVCVAFVCATAIIINHKRCNMRLELNKDNPGV